MIDYKASDDEQLAQARKLFVDAVDHYQRSRNEMHRASRFYHNTNLEGQWEWEDLQSLRDEGRPAFSFNLIAPKIRTWLGQYCDGKRRPTVVPKGGEDKQLAELLERVCDSIYADEGVESVDEEVLEKGIVKGEGNWHVNVIPDPDDPALIRIEVECVSPHDVMWDPGSQRSDRKDAGHFFWSKWLRKSEFISEYPQHRDAWDELEESGEAEGAYASDRAEMGVFHIRTEEYEDVREDAYFFDRNRNKVRVVHCEYKVPVKRQFLSNPANGLSERIEPDQVSLIRQMQDDGLLEGAEIIDTWDEEVYTLEFVGPKVLWKSSEDNPYQPYDGFSLQPFVCYLDDQSGTPYGAIRNLLDPQMEVNKARSVTLEHLADAPKSRMIAERGAVDDPEVFNQQLDTSGEVAWARDGAVAGQRFKEIPPPQPNPAAMERMGSSIELFELIANIETEVGNPAAQAEAAATQFLRYHRSRLGQRPIISHFEAGQRGVKKRVVQTVLRVMSDRQIEMILGNNEEYAVQNGTVYMLDRDEQGQLVPVSQIPLRGLRDLRYDIALETTSENTTLNMLEHQGLLSLYSAGVPVPPDILAEGATTSRSKRDQLRKYAKERGEAMMQQEQQAQQAQMEQMAGVLNVEHAKTIEQQRHNMAQEQLDWVKQLSDEQLEFLKVWEKADEAEKKALIDMAKVIESRQARRSSPARAGQGG